MKSMEAVKNTIISSLTECDSHLAVITREFARMYGGIKRYIGARLDTI